MPAHSRSQNGVASLAYLAGIHVFNASIQRRGWPEQVRPWRRSNPACAAAPSRLFRNQCPIPNFASNGGAWWCKVRNWRTLAKFVSVRLVDLKVPCECAATWTGPSNPSHRSLPSS